jgi:hypothetical protein
MDNELWDTLLDTYDLRQLQKEAARAISTMKADNNSIYKFNKVSHHNSQLWYRAVIKHYIEEHGGLPSEVGPGVDVKLLLDEEHARITNV